MAGTREGGQKAAATNKKTYGADFYAKIGAKGGRLGRTGGFAANRDLARRAGAIGGRKSRRGALTEEEKDRREAARSSAQSRPVHTRPVVGLSNTARTKLEAAQMRRTEAREG